MRSRRKSPLKRIFSIILFIAIGVAVFYLYKKYSFTNERANLAEYLYVTNDQVAIFLNDEPKSKEETENGVKMRALKSNDTVVLLC